MSYPTIKIGEGFSYYALEEVARLFERIACTDPIGYNNRISLEHLEIKFNQNTGAVYAVDEHDNCFKVNREGELEQYYVLHGTGIEGFYDDLMKMYNEGNIKNDYDLAMLGDIARSRHDNDAALLINTEFDYENEVGWLQKGIIFSEEELRALRTIAEKFGHENTVAMCNEALEDIKAKSSKENAYER